MQTVDDIIDLAEKLDIRLAITLSLVDSSDDFIDIQREQLAAGLREDSKPIFNIKTGSPNYSPGYAKVKGKSNPIDLHLTGAFYGDIFLAVENYDDFNVDSGDSKSEKLQENYGTAIFGLNDQSLSKFYPIGQQNLINEVQKALS